MGTLGCDVKGEGVDNLGEGTTPLSTHPVTPEVEGGYTFNASVRVRPSWCFIISVHRFFFFYSLSRSPYSIIMRAVSSRPASALADLVCV
jgi:hypothetical protein